MATRAYFAVTAQGIERSTARELEQLDVKEIRPVNGGVHFAADVRGLYRALLWLRTASRVLCPLREFAAGSQEMLYSQTRRVRWEDFLSNKLTFAVYTTSDSSYRNPDAGSVRRGGRQPPPRDMGRSPRGMTARQPIGRGTGPGGRPDPRGTLTNTQFAALKIKDAIADRMRRETGSRPDVDTEQPDFRVHAHFASGRCTLSLDATGDSLHERGYRVASTEAPMKESLGAALVMLSGWDGQSTLLDPMCGSGTLVIEAALWGLNVAPGLSRERFACQRWPDFDGAVWAEVTEAARQARREQLHAPIYASDIDSVSITYAQANAKKAGVLDSIRFSTADATMLPRPQGPPGLILTNPPYGERLGDAESVSRLYEQLGRHWLAEYQGWTAAVLCGNLNLARSFPLEAVEKIALRNGPLTARLLVFPIREPAAAEPAAAVVAEPVEETAAEPTERVSAPDPDSPSAAGGTP